MRCLSLAAVAALILSSAPAGALPLGPLQGAASRALPPIPVADSCGYGSFRDEQGVCRTSFFRFHDPDQEAARARYWHLWGQAPCDCDRW